MRVLHYSLGLPPYRSGGLTKYSYDLMRTQILNKNEVFLLYPGHFDLLKKTRINRNKGRNNIEVYEIVNPLPVVLLGGVGKPQEFTRECDKKIYFKFLRYITPDIIHVHTLMGLHKEFLQAAKELRIKVIFTSHDYYGFCSKVNLINYNNEPCLDFCNGINCIKCNQNSYSMKLLYFMQSRTYRKLKNNNIVKRIRENKKNHLKKPYLCKKEVVLNKKNISNEYIELKNYYLYMFKLMDYFHFNSTLAQEIYNSFISLNGEVINISHCHIKDRRMKKEYYTKGKLKITYLGCAEIYKGFYMLINSLSELKQRSIIDWHLNVYGNYGLNKEEYNNEFITMNGRYNYRQLSNIFINTDILIVPSICKETFGYTVLEALSYGVPVMVTENVGSKEILTDNKTGIIVKASEKNLSYKLGEIISNREILSEINKNIIDMDFCYDMNNHEKNMKYLYEKVVKRYDI